MREELRPYSPRSIRSRGRRADDDDPTIEDVHHYVEKRLVELAGEGGYKLHTGRSRNEQIATDLRLYVREQIDVHLAICWSSLLERS